MNSRCVRIRKPQGPPFPQSPPRPTPSQPSPPVHPGPSPTRLGKRPKDGPPGGSPPSLPAALWPHGCLGPSSGLARWRAPSEDDQEGQATATVPNPSSLSLTTKLRQQSTSPATPEASTGAVPAGIGGGSQGRLNGCWDCGRGQDRVCS